MFVAGTGPSLLAIVAPTAINVDLDLTFLVQAALFVGLMFILKPLLLDPMLKLFEARELRIEGAKLQARRMDNKSATALERYDAEMAKARAQAGAERDKIRAEGLAREAQILNGVRTATAEALESGKRAAHTEAERVRTRLRADARDMARELASRTLGREVQP